MKRIIKYTALLLVCFAWSFNALALTDEKDPVQVVFRFVNGDDMLYVPFDKNADNLDILCNTLKENAAGKGSVYVDGYSNSKQVSMIRCNRVKSELIIRTGINENTFTTTNNVGEFNGMKNVVVVTVVIPEEKKEEIAAATTTEPATENKPSEATTSPLIKMPVQDAGKAFTPVAQNTGATTLITPDFTGISGIDKDQFTFNENMLDEDEDVIQGTSAMTTSSDDYFLSEIGYRWSSMRFKHRGYDSQYNNVYANGALLNDAERGTFSYGMIGGLNDATRNQESSTFLENSGYGYSSVGGSSNINMRASQYAPGHKMSFVACNRNYLARLMYTYSTGLMNNGWAFTASASYRWANEGVIEGTFYNSLGYYFCAQKIINDKHSISIATWGSPTERGQQGAATEEAYWLANDHYYNPNWGYQNGEKRNARVVTSYEPTALLTWDFKINRETKLTTSAAAKYSIYGTTALGWNGNAADPRPNYYKNLPSSAYEVWDLNYYDDADNAINQKDNYNAWWRLYNKWTSSKANRQLDWDYMYFANRQANAVGGECLYYVEERHNDQLMLSIGSVLEHEFNKRHRGNIGVNLNTTKGMHYKKMNDLLGAHKYTDIDKFSAGDHGTNSYIIQNDLDNPNRLIREGDKFGYDYNIYVNKANLFAQYLYDNDHIHFYAGANIDGTTIQREGNMRNGRATWFDENGVMHDISKGKSDIARFLAGGAKASLLWNINGNNKIMIGGGYSHRAPLAYNSFIAPRIREDFVEGLETEKVLNGEISYAAKYGPFSTKISGFYTRIQDAVQQSAFYNDSEGKFTYLTMTGVEKTYFGGEFSLVYNVTSALSFNFLASITEAQYTKNAHGTLMTEDQQALDNSQSTVYMDGARIGGSPLTALSLGVDYNTNGWYLSANLNYYDRIYVSPSLYARLESIVTSEGGIDINGNTVTNLPSQYQGKGGFMLDASIGKSINLRGGKKLNINLSLSNILNNEKMVTGGYEQNRGDFNENNEQKIYKFSKNPFLYYANSFNAYLNIGLRF